mmetsp:Transcript_31562/g.102852  ORF Transcript_31562/g.102852 Transcript_31562/m.102852 type:complete len:204 (+) Transcript_31562:1155-1766(+)
MAAADLAALTSSYIVRSESRTSSSCLNLLPRFFAGSLSVSSMSARIVSDASSKRAAPLTPNCAAAVPSPPSPPPLPFPEPSAAAEALPPVLGPGPIAAVAASAALAPRVRRRSLPPAAVAAAQSPSPIIGAAIGGDAEGSGGSAMSALREASCTSRLVSPRAITSVARTSSRPSTGGGDGFPSGAAAQMQPRAPARRRRTSGH